MLNNDKSNHILNDTHPLADPSDPIGVRITKEVDASRRRVANAMGAVAALTDPERRALIAELLWEEEKRETARRHDPLAELDEIIEPIMRAGEKIWGTKTKPGLVRIASKAKTKTRDKKAPKAPTSKTHRGRAIDPNSAAGKVRAALAGSTTPMTIAQLVAETGASMGSARKACDGLVKKKQARKSFDAKEQITYSMVLK